ncbi:MAG TPA: PAS domain S-box protein, partial [Planctomycetaceae bacterium]|nr:PAS domain S-box protein [Planctomycetaceae bacterium]
SEFDCVVSDYDMDSQDGIEFLEQFRERYPKLPFILYTGKGSEEVASDAISAGVTDYLQKGSGLDQYTVLANRINNAVEQFRYGEALENSEKRLSLFIEQSPLGVIEWNESFEVIQMNEAGEKILGYTAAELFGQSWETLVPEGQHESMETLLTTLRGAEGGFHSVNENVRKDGTIVICEWHNRIITDESGDTVSIFSLFQDITDRKESEAKLEQANERIEFALSEVTATVWELDPETEAITMYPTPNPIFGGEISTLSDCIDLLHPAERARVESVMQTAIETGQSSGIECRMGPEHDSTWIALQINPVEDESGVTRVIGLAQDISDRKGKLQQLTRLQQRTQGLMQT